MKNEIKLRIETSGKVLISDLFSQGQHSSGFLDNPMADEQNIIDISALSGLGAHEPLFDFLTQDDRSERNRLDHPMENDKVIISVLQQALAQSSQLTPERIEQKTPIHAVAVSLRNQLNYLLQNTDDYQGPTDIFGRPQHPLETQLETLQETFKNTGKLPDYTPWKAAKKTYTQKDYVAIDSKGRLNQQPRHGAEPLTIPEAALVHLFQHFGTFINASNSGQGDFITQGNIQKFDLTFHSYLKNMMPDIYNTVVIRAREKSRKKHEDYRLLNEAMGEKLNKISNVRRRSIYK